MSRVFASLDYVAIADPTANTITAYTLVGWARWTGAQNGTLITGTDGSGPTVTWSHALRMASGVFQTYAFDGSARSLNGSTSVPTGAYIHFATVVENGQPMKLYVSGVLEATSGFTIGTLFTGLDRWRVGNSSSGTLSWSGDLAELAMFRSALTAPQIASLAAGTDTPLTVGPTPRWYLPLCGTGTETDASGNALTVAVSGTPSSGTHPNGIANGCGFSTSTGAVRLCGPMRIKTRFVGGVLS